MKTRLSPQGPLGRLDIAKPDPILVSRLRPASRLRDANARREPIFGDR